MRVAAKRTATAFAIGGEWNRAAHRLSNAVRVDAIVGQLRRVILRFCPPYLAQKYVFPRPLIFFSDQRLLWSIRRLQGFLVVCRFLFCLLIEQSPLLDLELLPLR